MNDPYAVLGISRNASDDEVKKAYRAMCRKYHPDKNPGNTAAEEMFKVVGEAYDQIMNERKGGGSNPFGYGGAGFGQSGFGQSGFGQSGYYSAGTGSAGYSASADQDSTYYQAAANYINSRHFNEALNVLNNISNRGAQWYYMSAVANYGLGNNYAAQEQARTAAAMDPSNMVYRNLVNQVSGAGFNYTNMQRPYYSSGMGTGNFCCDLCIANMMIETCCDLAPCLCCCN